MLGITMMCVYGYSQIAIALCPPEPVVILGVTVTNEYKYCWCV